VLLEKFSNICAAAGDEQDMRSAIQECISGWVDEIGINPLGNLVAKKEGKDTSRSLLLTAHMDEVAFIVKSTEKSGLIKFYPIGGLVGKILPGASVVIGRKRLPGVIASRSYHLISEEERKKVPEVKDLFIDVGAASKEEVKDVNTGEYIYFKSLFFTQNGLHYGKAFDDRTGCTALCETLRHYSSEKPPISLVATFTVQEEVGLRGGATAAYGLKNVVFNLNLEGTTCTDRELKTSYSPITELGKGPAVTFMDRTSITGRRLFDFVVSVAQKQGIPFQLKRGVAGGTDAGLIHLTEEGIPSVTISVPVRYIHSPWNLMSGKDFKNYCALAKAIVQEAPDFS
jgi:putative aminopeptidase FrvX